MAKMISHGGLGMKTIIFVWVTIFIVFSTVIEGRQISREDYLEAKRLVKLSRRPSVKSIQVDNGDIYDCVIIDKQLAFEHPALKNHTIRMKPTSIPEWPKDEGSNRTSPSIGLKGGGCPVGSVPIRRIEISDILRSTSVSSFGRKLDVTSGHRVGNFDLLWATIQNRGGFIGGKASVNLWNPKVNGENQFSLSQVWAIHDGPNKPVETIEAGWTVFPATFGGHQTRLFTYWTSDGYQRTGCYNTFYPGFVQVSQTLPLGYPFTEISSYDGAQSYVDIAVIKDRATDDWWLHVNNHFLGYWPKRLFNRLSGATTRVDWGGEVLNPLPNRLPWPQMGSGHFPDGNHIYGKSCSISNMQLFHGDGKWYDIGNTAAYESKPNCYKVIDAGNKGGWKRIAAFGGAGGQC